MPKGVFNRPPDMGVHVSEGKSPGSIARKEKVRELYSQGMTPTEISRKLEMPLSTVKGWVVGVRKHSTGFSLRKHGQAAARVSRLTGREGEAIRLEMEAKHENDCFFCQTGDYAESGWFRKVFHHEDDGTVERAHSACNAIRRHQTVTSA